MVLQQLVTVRSWETSSQFVQPDKTQLKTHIRKHLTQTNITRGKWRVLLYQQESILKIQKCLSNWIKKINNANMNIIELNQNKTFKMPQVFRIWSKTKLGLSLTYPISNFIRMSLGWILREIKKKRRVHLMNAMLMMMKKV